MREKILGLPVDILDRTRVLSTIENWLKKPSGKLRLLVTAYSEFYVKASRDEVFANIMNKADMVTPDGRSVLAAVEYSKKTQKLPPEADRQNSKTQNIVRFFWEGIKVGGRILRNDLGETVTGVWLFEELTKLAERRDWKVFILGGWNNVAARATKILLERHPRLRIESYAGETSVGSNLVENERVLERINKFKPDILFVSYNPVKQEKWIYSNRSKLKVGVAMGIGGTLDEFVGDLRLAPIWMESLGLKWLWRLWLQPSRWRRIVDAVIVFPWLVFKDSLRYEKTAK